MKTKETVKLNKSAMQFVDERCYAKFSEGSDGAKTPTIDMCVYSGGVIKDHWYWGDLAIDLEGMAFPKSRMPILEDHSTSLKIGFATKMSVENHQLTVLEATYLDTTCSLEFQKNSAAGFPYEASMYAKPISIERVLKDETVMVNGYIFTGPGTVWRKSTFKEASVCTFGYDPNTRSAAMSEGDTEEFVLEYVNKKVDTKLNKEDGKIMNREMFKTEHPEEFKALVEEATGTIAAKFSEERTALESKIASMEAANTKLSEENKGAESRLVALEKIEAIRVEKELGFSAEAVFAEQFKASGLPDRLSEKVRKLVSHDKFVIDGKLDTEAFKAAVDTELTDWSPIIGATNAPIGFGSSTKEAFSEGDSKTTDDAVARLLSHVQ